MGRILLCTGKYAEKPYHFEQVDTDVYCVEELCYLLSENPLLIDAGIMDKKLAVWLYEECDLKELSHQLLSMFQRGCQPGTFVDAILSYVQYTSETNRNKISRILKDNASLGIYEKKKKQADFLMENRKYQMALEEYENLLQTLPETEKALVPVIYHNMGVAACYLFRFESGAKFFKKAYELSGEEESGIQYLGALRQQMNDGEYISFIADNNAYFDLSMKLEKRYEAAKQEFETTEENRMLSALKIFRDEGNTTSYYEEIDKIISEMKENYRKSVEG